jgi:peptide/nickel transport system ATP-binding protein
MITTFSAMFAMAPVTKSVSGRGFAECFPAEGFVQSESAPLARTLAAISLTAESLTAESLTAESLTAESLTAESLTAESLTAESLTAESLTAVAVPAEAQIQSAIGWAPQIVGNAARAIWTFPFTVRSNGFAPFFNTMIVVH